MFAILSSRIRVYTICHSQQSEQGLDCLPSQLSDQCLHYLPFSVWSGSTLFAILRNLIRVYTICHSFQVVLSRSTLFAILRSQIRIYTSCHYFLTVLFRSTLFAILSSLIRVYTICHSRKSHQGLHCLPFSAVWSRSTLLALLGLIRVYTISILSSLIRFYTICHSQSDQCLHHLPFSVWSVSTPFAILSSQIRI